MSFITTADGWTVKRTRGGLTEDCGAAGSEFWMKFGSYCFVDLSAPSETFWCEDSSGQKSDNVSLSVQSETTDIDVILEIPALPVRTGSDVILRCRQRNGDTVKAFFNIKGSRHGPKREHNITKITQADEGLYWCSTEQGRKSPQSSLRVRDPPKIIHPPPPHCPSPRTSSNFAPPLTYPPLPASTCPPPPPPSLLVPIVAGLVSGLLLVLVLGLVLFLCWKLKGSKNPSPPPVDMTYADVTIKQRANRRDKYPADLQAVYSDVRTQTSGPEDVAYGQVVIKSKKKAGKRKEQSADPCAVYSSVRAGS
ncbi:uncharacterized protein LOC113015692 [Astatotilapia calliptera]|uniref:uncharacterized protein LOC113015692 n=1 Tax=Astatotilapia calliptera TaxID=8154 RepID=UPI000E4200C5|nr:uncharacterized protein LOC113015692 [Astatotilapia calliptera]